MRLVTISALAMLAGCSAVEQAITDGPRELPVITLSEPTLEIGAIDGAEEYLFGQIEASLRLPSGEVAVADASNSRILVYDAAGTFVRGWGRQGDGPGEFRGLSRIYLKGDSILAADQRTRVVTAFDMNGTRGDQGPGQDISGDSMFVFDSWLHGRFWVDGALDAASRSRVRATLNALPAPHATPGYRAARVAANGDLWFREPDVSAGGLRSWTRVNASGTPTAILEIPTAFDPLDIQRDEVLGRWTGDSDVSYVRAYRLVASAQTRRVPSWLLGEEAAPAVDGEAPDEAAVRALIVSTIKNLASHQEIHYSTAMSYTTDLGALGEFEIPEGLEIDFLVGNARGWAAVFAHPDFDRLCGLAYGYMIPAGWSPGMVTCAPALPESASGEGR